jgi:hypothetical protein
MNQQVMQNANSVSTAKINKVQKIFTGITNASAAKLPTREARSPSWLKTTNQKEIRGYEGEDIENSFRNILMLRRRLISP